jgi:hypothetical protein
MCKINQGQEVWLAKKSLRCMPNYPDIDEKILEN